MDPMTPFDRGGSILPGTRLAHEVCAPSPVAGEGWDGERNASC
jgi:hypothetical protein